MSNGIVELGAMQNTRNPYSYEKVVQLTRDITSSWLTLEEITNQLNLFQDDSQDEYLSDLELATRMAIEDYLGLTIFPVTWKVYYGNATTINTETALDLPEVSEGAGNTVINSVTYFNDANPPVEIALETSAYYYDPTGNKVVVTGFPSSVNTFMSNPIMVTYTTNPNEYAQYPNIKQAGLLLLTHLYNQRSNTTSENLKELPYGVAQLLRPYKPLVM